jgi:hypothetical protein
MSVYRTHVLDRTVVELHATTYDDDDDSMAADARITTIARSGVITSCRGTIAQAHALASELGLTIVRVR